MKKIILFDVGGVLVNWKDIWLFDEVVAQYKIPKKILIKRFNQHIEYLFTGKIMEQNFWEIILDGFLGKVENLKIIDKVFQKKSSINNNVLSLAKKLKKQNYKIGILSNLTPQTRHMLFDQKIFEPFEYQFFSDVISLAKPNPKIFYHVSKKIGRTKKDIILIDDKKENVEAAIKFGFNGIHYENFTNLKSDLKCILN